MVQPTETQNTIHIKIEEAPIAGMFYIRDKWLQRAKKFNKRLVLHYNGNIFVTTYKEWMTGAKKMEKEFLIPGQPMKLYGNYVNRFKRKDSEVKNVSILGNENTIGLFLKAYKDSKKAH